MHKTSAHGCRQWLPPGWRLCTARLSALMTIRHVVRFATEQGSIHWSLLVQAEFAFEVPFLPYLPVHPYQGKRRFA